MAIDIAATEDLPPPRRFVVASSLSSWVCVGSLCLWFRSSGKQEAVDWRRRKSIKFKLNTGKARGRHLQAVQCVDVRVAVEVRHRVCDCRRQLSRHCLAGRPGVPCRQEPSRAPWQGAGSDFRFGFSTLGFVGRPSVINDSATTWWVVGGPDSPAWCCLGLERIRRAF